MFYQANPFFPAQRTKRVDVSASKALLCCRLRGGGLSCLGGLPRFRDCDAYGKRCFEHGNGEGCSWPGLCDKGRWLLCKDKDSGDDNCGVAVSTKAGDAGGVVSGVAAAAAVAVVASEDDRVGQCWRYNLCCIIRRGRVRINKYLN